MTNKGDLVSSRSKKSSYFKETVWKWRSPVDEKESLERHIREILSFLRSRKDQVLSLSDCQIDIFCGIFSDNEQIGFYVDSKIIRDIAHYPIDLIFDAYSDMASTI